MCLGLNSASPFNSRPHKEVDMYPVTIQDNDLLSIHDLTRRSTLDVFL